LHHTLKNPATTGNSKHRVNTPSTHQLS